VIECLGRWRWPAFAAAMALAIVPNLPHLAPASYQDLDLHLWTPQYLAELGVETTTSGEFMPRWMRVLPPYRPEARLISGDGSVTTTRAQLRSAATIELPTAYFPGWEVRVDGRAVPIYPAESTGLIRFALAPGDHAIQVEWKRTAPRWAGDIVSAVALLACAAFAMMKK
jgi:hypothetical protein